ncbi:MAG: GspE/PulE family protein [Acidobacteriota bacterium]
MLRVVALLVAVTGLVCLYLFWRPADLAAVGAALSHVASDALANRMVPIAALAALVAAIAARWLDRLGSLPPRTPGVHALELGPEEEPALAPLELSPEPPEAPAAGRAGDSGLPLDRHLHGKPDIPAFVDDLLKAAVVAGASDVHIQPLEIETRIAWRLRGELAEQLAAPREHHEQVVRRLKVLAQLTYQTEMPQDGRFTLETPQSAIDVRMSVLPTRHGEKVVLRLARSGQGLIELGRLGMADTLRADFEGLLAQPQGLIILTGPTGCGKTTTLYSALTHIHRSRGATTSIATIEDPIEIDLPFSSQTQVDHNVGLSFGQSLRAVLRQDPDVMMVGEIRDRETAHIAVEAGMTGHLILTTLHADSNAGVFNRLIEMGVEPFVASSAVLATLSQRLVRRLCDRCRQPAAADPKMTERLVRRGISQTAAESLSFYQSPGCDACGHSGLGAQTAVFELLAVTPTLSELISSKVPTSQIEEAAISEGMTPLLRAAVLEAVAGTISLEEAFRVMG